MWSPFRLFPRTGSCRDTLLLAEKSNPLTAAACFVISVIAVRAVRGVASADLDHHGGDIAETAGTQSVQLILTICKLPIIK
jgi:hypothetical protein